MVLLMSPGCLLRPALVGGIDQAQGQRNPEPMLRIQGDRNTLLALLVAQWAEQQLQIPQPLRPQLRSLNQRPRPER
jgi:hypothetical protein